MSNTGSSTISYLIYSKSVPVFLQRAIEEGADFIETDVLSSKDGVLICFHDVILDLTTDIAEHKEFADRKRSYELQGFNVSGFFIGTEVLPTVNILFILVQIDCIMQVVSCIIKI